MCSKRHLYLSLLNHPQIKIHGKLKYSDLSVKGRDAHTHPETRNSHIICSHRLLQHVLLGRQDWNIIASLARKEFA